MNIPTAGELRKMDGVEITAVTNLGKEISGIIVVKGDEVGIAHNNPKANGWKVKEVHGYKYGSNLGTYNRPDNYITTDIAKIISLGKTKVTTATKVTLTYETQYLRSDGVVFTKDTIDGKKIEALKQEMKDAMSKVNKIRGLLKAHKNKF